MRILIVSCVFPPEPVVSARTSADLAEALSARGHAVTVVTAFPSRPAGRLYSGYRRKWTQTGRAAAGYTVVRCFSFLASMPGLRSRFLENLSFGVTGAWAALTAGRPDVIYSNTWPIMAAGLLACVARCRRIPLVVSVQDVYPESLLAQKRLGAAGILARIMRRIDRWIARQCAAVLVISQRFEKLYREDRGVPAERLHYVPNWFDERQVAVQAGPASVFRAAQGIPPSAFLCVYGGNIGTAAGVETLVEAFDRLRSRADCYLLVAGAGSRLEACRQKAAAGNNPRVLFHSPWPAEETALVLAAADLLVLPTRGRQAHASVPSKLIAYLLAGRPVLALAPEETELADLVSAAGGWLASPDDPGALAAAIEKIAACDKTLLTQRGFQGKNYALKHLTRAVVLPVAVGWIEEAGKTRR